MTRGNRISPPRPQNSTLTGCAVTARRPRDGPGVFKEEIGLTGQEWVQEWARIKLTVNDILVHQGLLGNMPSSLRDPAQRTKIGEQVESIHLQTFSPIKPSADRRKLVLRIVAYEMEGEIGRAHV